MMATDNSVRWLYFCVLLFWHKRRLVMLQLIDIWQDEMVLPWFNLKMACIVQTVNCQIWKFLCNIPTVPLSSSRPRAVNSEVLITISSAHTSNSVSSPDICDDVIVRRREYHHGFVYDRNLVSYTLALRAACSAVQFRPEKAHSRDVQQSEESFQSNPEITMLHYCTRGAESADPLRSRLRPSGTHESKRRRKTE